MATIKVIYHNCDNSKAEDTVGYEVTHAEAGGLINIDDASDRLAPHMVQSDSYVNDGSKTRYRELQLRVHSKTDIRILDRII